MAIPPGAGRLNQSQGKSISRLVVEDLQIFSWADVERYLIQNAAGPASVREALSFYQGELSGEIANPRAGLLELLGIDFYAPVQRLTLAAGMSYLTYAKTSPAPAGVRPNEGRVRLDEKTRQPLVLHLGGFLTDVGTGPNRLGIAMTPPRLGVKLRLLQPVVALQSRASGLVDAWSDAPAGAGAGIPRLATGGGVQYRVSRTKVRSDSYFAIT